MTKRKYSKTALVAIALFMAMTVIVTAFLTAKPAVSAISRDGVVTDIQKMAKLTTVSFGVDTVITAQKEGSWQKLWQDEQKGLFIAKGRVVAGVDLSKITADDVTLSEVAESYPDEPSKTTLISINLPKSEIFDVYLDDIQVYDWQTGLFGVVDNDPEILAQAQASAKAEVLKKACQGDIMTLAKDNAGKQIEQLFALTGASVAVKVEAGACEWAN